jgi:hypothetical protein
MLHWVNQPWQRNLRKTVSGKTGAVHSPDTGLRSQQKSAI